MFLAFEVCWSRGPDGIRGTSEKASGVWSVLWQWMYFSNDVLIRSCALSVMNRESQTLDEPM